MIKTRKITLSVLLISAVALFTACGSIDKEAVTKKVTSFAAAAAEFNADKMLKNTSGIDDSTAQKIRDKMSMSGMDDKERIVKQAIAKTISYDVDSDSITPGKKDNYVNCNIIFSIVDYEAVLSDRSLTDVNSIITAISSSSSTKRYSVECELVLKKEKYSITENSIRRLADLYSFLDATIKFTPTGAEVYSMITDAKWSGTGISDLSYTNTDILELDISFYEDPDIDYYYKVYRDGTEVFTSPTAHTSSDRTVKAVYSREQGALTEGNYIAEGQYEISLYNAVDNTLINTYTTYVRVYKPTPTPTPTPTSSPLPTPPPEPKSDEFEKAFDFLRTVPGNNVSQAKKMIEKHFGTKLKNETSSHNDGDNGITESNSYKLYSCKIKINGIVYTEVEFDYIDSNNYVYLVALHTDYSGESKNVDIYNSNCAQLYNLCSDPVAVEGYDEFTYSVYRFDDGKSCFVCYADWAGDGKYYNIISIYDPNDGYHTEDNTI